MEELKKETGLSINYYVNYAIVKQLVLDKILRYWELDDKKPQYENIVKFPEEAIELNKFCDGDSCEIPFMTAVEVVDFLFKGNKNPKGILKGEKC